MFKNTFRSAFAALTVLAATFLPLAGLTSYSDNPGGDINNGCRNCWIRTAYDRIHSGKVVGTSNITNPEVLYTISRPSENGYHISDDAYVGDIDGDGKNEIAFTIYNVATDSSALYLYNGATGAVKYVYDFGGGSWSIGFVGSGLYDLNDDGKMEILVSGGSGTGTTKALTWSDGGLSVLWTVNRYFLGVEVANVVGDDKPEIVAGDYSSPRRMHLYNGQTGEEIWSVETGGSSYNEPLVADINNDGRKEIVFTAHHDSGIPSGKYGDGERVFALNDQGTILWTFDVRTYSYLHTPLADFDNDGELEVLAADGFALYYLKAATGVLERTIPFDNYTPIRLSFADVYANPSGMPGSRDSNDVANLEIAYSFRDQSDYTKSGLYLLKAADGSSIWKRNFRSPSNNYLSNSNWPIPIVDIDGDGELEILWSYTKTDDNLDFLDESYLEVYDGEGNLEWSYAYSNQPRSVLAQVITADVNNDGLLEIILVENWDGDKIITVLKNKSYSSCMPGDYCGRN